nr:E-beta-farnesene synthase [Tanacetum cinerariifolium]
HKFHPRLDSLLHLPNEEPVLGYLKFSAKGTKREVFGMPIPGSLIIADIQEASYYQEYLAKVAKHQRKPKPTAPKAHPRPSVSKPVSSTQPEPTSAPAKPQGKKRKLTIEISNKPSKAIKFRHGFVYKKRKPISTLRSVDELVAEDVPAKEPRVDDEEADVQRALEERMKSMYDVPRGLLPPVVIREPEFKKYQPLPKVLGKGKEKVIEDQVAHNKEESKKDVPGDDAGGQGEGQARPDFGAQAEGQAGPDPGAQDEGQAGSNPDEQPEGQAGPDPSNAETSQPFPSPVVYAGSDREHMDLMLLMSQHNLHMSKWMKGSLQRLIRRFKRISSSRLKNSDKPSEADNDNATAETKAESMVSVTIQQDMSSIPSMTTPTIDLTSRPESPKHRKCHDDKAYRELEHIMANLIQENKRLEQRLDNHGAHLYTLEQLDIPHRVSKAVDEVVTDVETDSYKSHEDHMQLYEALEKSMNRGHSEELAKDLVEALVDDEDIGNARIPKVNLRQDWWKPLEEERPATPEPTWSILSSDVPVPTNNWASDLASNYSPPSEDSLLAQTSDIAMFMDWFCKSRGITELKPQDLEGPAFEIIKVFHPDQTITTGWSTWSSHIQSDFFFNKDLEYLRYGSKGSRPALSISKMKAAYYPDVGLEQLVPDQMWIEEECKYDIAAMYGISHWWFQRQRFYIDRHTSEGDRRAVRTHMRILSVVRIEVFSMYGYDYMKQIVLRRTRHLVIRQRVEDFQLETESYQTQLNLTKPRWDATGFEYKHDYTVINSLRAVTFQDRYRVQMIMRFNEIHKFSDGTLQQIDEALDYQAKEFKINMMNPGLNMRFRTRKDVDRSKAFMFAIQK